MNLGHSWLKHGNPEERQALEERTRQEDEAMAGDKNSKTKISWFFSV